MFKIYCGILECTRDDGPYTESWIVHWTLDWTGDWTLDTGLDTAHWTLDDGRRTYGDQWTLDVERISAGYRVVRVH